MKLSPITREHVLRAAEQIDREGIPKNYVHSTYWVKMSNGREYPFKHLTRTAYQFTDQKDKEKFDFESNHSYRGYIKGLGFEMTCYKENLSFFNQQEIELFQTIAGKPYRKENEEHVRKGRLLLPLVKKLNKWGELSLVDNFEFRKDNSWLWPGTFKSYLWLRLYRPGDSQMVFFLLEINKEGQLDINLNCQSSNYSARSGTFLSKKLATAFFNHRDASGFQRRLIPKEALPTFNWDRLIAITQEFILEYEFLYDELEAVVSERERAPIDEFALEQTTPPTHTKSFTDTERSFKGRKTDWGKKHRNSQQLGNKGEQLVIDWERQKLEKLGLKEKANQVEKKLDGEGYDVLSFDEHGKEKHIEVKTTRGSYYEPFYMSANERAYLEKHPDNYYLYRLYAYDSQRNTAKFYVMSAKDLGMASFRSTNYEVSLKDNK